jgi:hypothetical protein
MNRKPCGRKTLVFNWIDLAQDRESSFEHSNESSGSMKFWEILEWLSDWRILKKGSAPWN